MRLVAVAGRIVKDPRNGREIPKEGIEIAELDTYWFRRVKTGDVVIADPPPAPEEKKKSKA